MERLDGARRVQRWRISMKSLLCSMFCTVMAVRLRKVPRWENMDRDILAKIFEKLNVIDVTMGVSRVCISWFLVSHQKSLLKTIELAYLQHVDLNHPRLKHSRVLIEIAKFCSTVPTGLFFNIYSCVEDKDLIIAAERIPNIKKIALPRWGNVRDDA
ncbi:unnamed protein product [Thlaspi arvense]|uniref:F-box domain-containing protein n=1 Tax=Thlaspi arvense TaxID=13288 RepID=A0AAU9RUZ0_THLAR|nr:unnamed protein product [Thlaspi arvense]